MRREQVAIKLMATYNKLKIFLMMILVNPRFLHNKIPHKEKALHQEGGAGQVVGKVTTKCQSSPFMLNR